MAAEREILKHVQQKVFAEEIRSLTERGQVNTSSRVRKLDPIMVDGLLRVFEECTVIYSFLT